MELPEKTTNTTLKDQVLERSKVRLNEKKNQMFVLIMNLFVNIQYRDENQKMTR